MKRLIFLLLLAAILRAQPAMVNPTTGNLDYFGLQAVATLPAAASSSGKVVIFTADSATGACSGSGTAVSLCRSNGSAWVSLGGATPSDATNAVKGIVTVTTATSNAAVATDDPRLSTQSLDSTSPITVAATSGYNFNNGAGAVTYNLPTITSAMVTAVYTRCFRNYTTRTGAITLQAPASTYIDVDGANGTAAGTLVSAGAAGDSVCLVATSTTQYVAYVGRGAWTNN